jgi:hypothetical protein
VVELAAEQIGIAVLPRSALAGTSGVAQRGLADTDPSLERRLLLVARPAGTAPAGRGFLALARHHLAPEPGEGRAPGSERDAPPPPASAARE